MIIFTIIENSETTHLRELLAKRCLAKAKRQFMPNFQGNVRHNHIFQIPYECKWHRRLADKFEKNNNTTC